jgi:hypothetical protein
MSPPAEIPRGNVELYRAVARAYRNARRRGVRSKRAGVGSDRSCAADEARAFEEQTPAASPLLPMSFHDCENAPTD